MWEGGDGFRVRGTMGETGVAKSRLPTNPRDVGNFYLVGDASSPP